MVILQERIHTTLSALPVVSNLDGEDTRGVRYVGFWPNFDKQLLKIKFWIL